MHKIAGGWLSFARWHRRFATFVLTLFKYRIQSRHLWSGKQMNKIQMRWFRLTSYIYIRSLLSPPTNADFGVNDVLFQQIAKSTEWNTFFCMQKFTKWLRVMAAAIVCGDDIDLLWNVCFLYYNLEIKIQFEM